VCFCVLAILGLHRFGAIDASPASPASSSADRVTPTNTLGSARFSHGLLRHPKEPLDCAPDATGAVHCVSPGAFKAVPVARDGTPVEAVTAPLSKTHHGVHAESVEADHRLAHDSASAHETLMAQIACAPDASGVTRCVTPGAFPAARDVMPDGSPVPRPRHKASIKPRRHATKLGSAHSHSKSAPADEDAATKGMSCRPGPDGSMRCTSPGAFPAVNPDALEVPRSKDEGESSTASAGKARKSASSEKEETESSKKDSKHSKKHSKKDSKKEPETPKDVVKEDADAQVLSEANAVAFEDMADERRERHPATYQVVDAAYQAQRTKDLEAQAKAEAKAAKKAVYTAHEDASELAEREKRSWEASAATEITPDRMAQFKEMEMEDARAETETEANAVDDAVDDKPKRLHEPRLFCTPDENGKMKCVHSLVAAAQ
jgi:hypothetical protein